ARRRLGSEGRPFPAIVACGPRSALPHARSRRRVVAAGEWLLLDFGAQVDGYCADITRTVVVGARATERQRAVYELVAEAQRRARACVRGGMSGRGADALAGDVVEARGFREVFGPLLGHGQVLVGHEAPRGAVSPRAPGAQAGVAAPGVPAKSQLVEIKSPMVGTFYAAPEPGAAPYVKAGSRVATGQVVCIIEAMKIMNEIEAEVAGL